MKYWQLFIAVFCTLVTLTSLEESLEGGRVVLGMVMCGRVWSCVVVCGCVSFRHAMPMKNIISLKYFLIGFLDYHTFLPCSVVL